MAVRFFFLGGAYHVATGDLPDGAMEVPRLPLAGERWDGGRFVLDAGIAADLAAPAGHIDIAHVVKMVEASLILSGHRLSHGLLADEAAGNGLDLDVLAASVAGNAAAFRAIEGERRRAKWAARQGGGA